MRREERHHLKDNPVARFVAQAQDSMAGGSRALIGVVALVVVGLAGVGAYTVWQAQQADRAGAQLADALLIVRSEVATPPTDPAEGADDWVQPDGSFPSEAAKLEAAVPQLQAVADAFPGQPAGVTARYELASALVRLERPDEAAEHYQRVIDADPDGLHGRMARLGLAETRVLAGQYDAAVALLEPETEAETPAVPVDALLMRIGRAHELAGQDTDALAAFTRVVDEFPFSVYFPQARQKVDSLGPSPEDGTAGS